MKTLKITKLYGPFLWLGFNCLKATEHEETVYFLPLSHREFLVLILSTTERWKAESTLEPPSGFDLGTIGLPSKGGEIFNIYHILSPFEKLTGCRNLHEGRNEAVFLILEHSSPVEVEWKKHEKKHENLAFKHLLEEIQSVIFSSTFSYGCLLSKDWVYCSYYLVYFSCYM